MEDWVRVLQSVVQRNALQVRRGQTDPWVAHDAVCFVSFLDQKMLDKVIVKVSHSVVVVKF